MGLRIADVATAGTGLALISAYGRLAGQIAAVPSVCQCQVPSADGSFLVSGNIVVTVATNFSFSSVVDFTDETNAARTLLMPYTNTISSSPVYVLGQAMGAISFGGSPLHIRAKAGTFITVRTSGTFTTVTYNVDAAIIQIS